MKNPAIFLIILFLPLFVFSQSTNRNYIGLSVGPSFPSGSYKQTDISDSTSGWAKTGVALGFSYSYRFTHNLGVSLIINYSSNRFNISSYKNTLEELHPDTSFSVTSAANWGVGGILVGPYLRFPLSSNLSWDVRGLFGFFGGSSPKVTIKASTDDGNTEIGTYYRERAKAFRYAFMVGTGLKYKLSRYYILVFADYNIASLEFDNASGWDWNNEPYTIAFRQDLNYISLTFGVGYFF